MGSHSPSVDEAGSGPRAKSRRPDADSWLHLADVETRVAGVGVCVVTRGHVKEASLGP